MPAAAAAAAEPSLPAVAVPPVPAVAVRPQIPAAQPSVSAVAVRAPSCKPEQRPLGAGWKPERRPLGAVARPSRCQPEQLWQAEPSVPAVAVRKPEQPPLGAVARAAGWKPERRPFGAVPWAAGGACRALPMAWALRGATGCPFGRRAPNGRWAPRRATSRGPRCPPWPSGGGGASSGFCCSR